MRTNHRMMEEKPHRSLPASIFLSPNEPRLRAGWRLILQTALMLLVALLISVPVIIYFIWMGDLTRSSDLSRIDLRILIPSEITEFLTIAISVFLARRWFDRRSISSLGLTLDKTAFFDLLAGIGISFAIMAFIFAAEFFLGWAKFDGFAWRVDSVPQVVFSTLAFAFIFILTGWNEELLSRGYHLQNLTDGLNLPWGIILSSAVFGLAHISNPGASWVAVFGIFVGGLFFAYAYYQTKQLWLPIGIHIGWNFAEGVIFDFPVSGLQTYSLLRMQFTGPTLWGGGTFGPEAGLILFPALVIGFGLVYIYTKFGWRNHEQ